ncbi:hypothetical protein JZ751_018779 [Albula glossodonta]|uniref:Uncharacterized protein n=1 Tax=Albula glossodonta TaxID=121402 RepID=A0A8T2NMX0_9TELE|nr:hypothetical protein JZ751_018779 [Albula glossodonta]
MALTVQLWSGQVGVCSGPRSAGFGQGVWGQLVYPRLWSPCLLIGHAIRAHLWALRQVAPSSVCTDKISKPGQGPIMHPLPSSQPVTPPSYSPSPPKTCWLFWACAWKLSPKLPSPQKLCYSTGKPSQLSPKV